MQNNRWKNYGLWVSVTSLVLLVLQNGGVIDFAQVTTYSQAVEHVLQALVLLGIISNPKENKGYLDQK